MPTDAIRDFHEISVETLKFGIPELKAAQYELGDQMRNTLDSRGLMSVAAPGFQAPGMYTNLTNYVLTFSSCRSNVLLLLLNMNFTGVLVYYSPASVENPTMMTTFKAHGLQIAMGVPWQIDEPEGLKTFRLGLFGLDKMGDIPDTMNVFEGALNGVLADCGHVTPEEAA